MWDFPTFPWWNHPISPWHIVARRPVAGTFCRCLCNVQGGTRFRRDWGCFVRWQCPSGLAAQVPFARDAQSSKLPWILPAVYFHLLSAYSCSPKQLEDDDLEWNWNVESWCPCWDLPCGSCAHFIPELVELKVYGNYHIFDGCVFF